MYAHNLQYISDICFRSGNSKDEWSVQCLVFERLAPAWCYISLTFSDVQFVFEKAEKKPRENRFEQASLSVSITLYWLAENREGNASYLFLFKHTPEHSLLKYCPEMQQEERCTKNYRRNSTYHKRIISSHQIYRPILFLVRLVFLFSNMGPNDLFSGVLNLWL